MRWPARPAAAVAANDFFSSRQKELNIWHFHCWNFRMKENVFYVSLSIRTADGLESFGKFNLGNNKKVAARIFAQLEGDRLVDEKTMLTIDLVETVNGLPVNLNILGCTLEQMGINCKIIVKESFKLFNLKK